MKRQPGYLTYSMKYRIKRWYREGGVLSLLTYTTFLLCIAVSILVIMRLIKVVYF